jgi:hypothetical protein
MRLSITFFIIIGTEFLVLGASALLIGFHSIDLSMNMYKLANSENFDINNYVDETVGGYFITYDTMYITGIKTVLMSAFLIFAGTWNFTIGIAMIPRQKKTPVAEEVFRR